MTQFLKSKQMQAILLIILTIHPWIETVACVKITENKTEYTTAKPNFGNEKNATLIEENGPSAKTQNENTNFEKSNGKITDNSQVKISENHEMKFEKSQLNQADENMNNSRGWKPAGSNLNFENPVHEFEKKNENFDTTEYVWKAKENQSGFDGNDPRNYPKNDSIFHKLNSKLPTTKDPKFDQSNPKFDSSIQPTDTPKIVPKNPRSQNQNQKPFKPSEQIGGSKIYHKFPNYPEPKFGEPKFEPKPLKFDDGKTASRVIFQDSDIGGYRIRENENDGKFNEYMLQQKAIRLQEKEVLLKSKEKLMERWIKENFPKRPNYDQNKNVPRIPSPTTVYEVKDIPPYPFVKTEFSHPKKTGGLGDFHHTFTNTNLNTGPDLEEQYVIQDEKLGAQLLDYRKHLDEMAAPWFGNFEDYKPPYTASNIGSGIPHDFYQNTGNVHKIHPDIPAIKYPLAELDIKEKHKAAVWKDISHILTALVPIGILISALKPNVLKVDSNSTNIRPTMQPVNPTMSMMSLPVRFRFLEQNFKDEFKNKTSCDFLQLCELAREGSGANKRAPQRALWVAVNNTPQQAIEKLGLTELFAAIKNDNCQEMYKCDRNHKKTQENDGKFVENAYKKT